MTLIALKDLPNRVKAGESFEELDGRGRVLIRLGLAKLPDPPRRRTYQRRDLQAEE